MIVREPGFEDSTTGSGCAASTPTRSGRQSALGTAHLFVARKHSAGLSCGAGTALYRSVPIEWRGGRE
jgi:hypothetical protein